VSDGATITLSPEQTAFAEAEVRAGRYPNVQAVVAEALSLLQDDPFEPDQETLKALLAERMKGPFVPMEPPDVLMAKILAELDAEFAMSNDVPA
jgi:antitoxin ParD1/3/4